MSEHPPEHGGEIEQRLQDPFDYEAEDKLIAILHEARERAGDHHPQARGDPASLPASEGA
jgi:hypothetical protein